MPDNRTMVTVKGLKDHFKDENGKPIFSDWFIYTKAKSGELPHVRIGSKILFCVETIEEYFRKLEKESVSGGELDVS